MWLLAPKPRSVNHIMFVNSKPFIFVPLSKEDFLWVVEFQILSVLLGCCIVGQGSFKEEFQEQEFLVPQQRVLAGDFCTSMRRC